jgi:hypothetical protein
MRKSQSLMLALLVLAISTQVGAQGRSPLLDKVVRSVNKHRPSWHFIPGVCTCPPLVPIQTSYAAGGWHPGNITSKRHVSIYISYVASVEDAAQWMAGLSQRDVVEGWRRDRYKLGDESYLWSANDGYSYLYFRKGSVVVELSGKAGDVKLFAEYAEKQISARLTIRSTGAESPCLSSAGLECLIRCFPPG